MKIKDKKIMLLALLAALMMLIYSSWKTGNENTFDSDDFIRFHVIANSDAKEDQELKLKVRDELIAYLDKTLLKAKSADESKAYIQSDLKMIEQEAEKVVKANGYDYSVTASLGKRWIPEKTYGNLTFPAGEYEALNIVIGSGKGHNWWCVLFPPLCLIDSKSSEEDFYKDALLSEKYKALLENKDIKRTVRLKFKTAETAEKLRKLLLEMKEREKMMKK